MSRRFTEPARVDALDPARADTLEAVALLADPLRREIVLRLTEEQLCTCHLVEMTGAAQPTVSYHLRLLREAGWVRAEPAGRYTYYRLEPEPLASFAGRLDELAEKSRTLAPRRACP